MTRKQTFGIMTKISQWVVLIATLLSAMPCMAQEVSVRGKVIDINGKPVEGVLVAGHPQNNSLMVVSDFNGNFRLIMVRKDTIELTFKHLVYKDTTIRVPVTDDTVVIPDVLIRGDVTELRTVSITETATRIEQRGDTTVYFADAYKMSSDATAYDMITGKLPGVSVNEGRISVAGEEVSGIYLDGKEYYAGDVVLALKNLPANIVNEIQVFDRVSDYSKATGFDDMNRERVIQIDTKRKTSTKLFGKILGGYGTDNRFNTYGSFNWTNQQVQLALFTQHNNINKQDFSILSPIGSGGQNTPGVSPYEKNSSGNVFMTENGMSENVSAGSTDGITLTNAAGFNIAAITPDEKFKVSGNYLFSRTNNTTEYDITDTWFSDSSMQSQNQSIVTNTMNHRMHANLEYKLSDKNTILFKPVVFYETKKESTNVDLSSLRTTQLINQSSEIESNALQGIGDLTFVHKLGRGRNSISINLKAAHQDSREETDLSVKQLPLTPISMFGNRITKSDNNQLNRRNGQMVGCF